MPTNQFTLYKKIAAYLAAVGGATEFSIAGGICSGLTALWLSAAAANQTEYFNDLCTRILEQAITSERDPDIEAILSAILIAQHNMYFLENAKQGDFRTSVTFIRASDKLADLQENFHLINVFTAAELENILQTLPLNSTIRFANYSHTIGLTRGAEGFLFFDSNDDLISELVADISLLTQKIFRAFKKDMTETLPLNITGYNTDKLLVQYSLPPDIVHKEIAKNAELLLLAIAAGDEELVVELITDYKDLIDTDPAPIYVAQSLYQHKIMWLLIEHGAKLDIQLATGNSTLLLASILQNKQGYYNGVPVDLGYMALNMFLAKGANPNFANAKKVTPVDIAIYRDKLQKLSLLLTYGATLSENNIQELAVKTTNTAKVWRLIQDVKLMQQTLNKDVRIDMRLYDLANYTLNLSPDTDQVKDTIEFLECITELRKQRLKIKDISIILDGHLYKGARAISKLNRLIADWAQNRTIDLTQAWHLYELSKPLTSWWRCGYTADLYANFRELLLRVDASIATINMHSLQTNAMLAISIVTILEALQHFTNIRAISISTHKFKHLAINTQNNLLNHLVQLFGLRSSVEVIPRLKALGKNSAQPITFLVNQALDSIDTPALSAIVPILRLKI